MGIDGGRKEHSLEDGGEHAFISEVLNGHFFTPLGFDNEKTPNVETFVISVEKESLGFLPTKSKM